MNTQTSETLDAATEENTGSLLEQAIFATKQLKAHVPKNYCVH